MEEEPKLWVNLHKDNLYLTYGDKIITISAQLLYKLFIEGETDVDEYVELIYGE